MTMTHYKNLYEIFKFCNENDHYDSLCSSLCSNAGTPNMFQQLLKNPSKSIGTKMMQLYIFDKMTNNGWTKDFLKESGLNEETIDKYLSKKI